VGELQAGLELQNAPHAYIVSYETIDIPVAYSIETAVETKFGSERPIDEFVVFGMYGQQGLDVCFGVLFISDNSQDGVE
jgi:hypothetical protein